MKDGTRSGFGLSNKPERDMDASLVSAAAGGDLDAFELLVRRHQSRIYNFVLRMTDSPEDAAEVTQDVFVAAFRRLKTFRGKSKFSTWLGAIAVNLSRNRLVKNRRRRANETPSLDAPVVTADGEFCRETVSDEPSALERLELQAMRRVVRDCIARLPIEFREVVVLRELQEMAYDEIADMLSLRAGTVKSRLSRAREAVKQCLQRAMGKLQ
jgi:RNA polymerase sigma-70 factor (ECF subfamily)